MIALVAVGALTLFFALDSFVRHREFDPGDQIEDYVEGRVTVERVARAWSKKDDSSSITSSIESAFSSQPEAQSSTEGMQSSEEQAFIAHLTDTLTGCKTLDLDALTLSSPAVKNREEFVSAIHDLCGHRLASVTINHAAQAPIEMPVDKRGNKLQFAGTLIVEFARDDLPEFHMNTLTFNPKSWENPVGQASDGTYYLIPVDDVIFKT
jgi:hypothetical protein